MRFILAISWLIFIAVLHALPANNFSSFSFLDWLHVDKLVHVFMFLVAFILLAFAVEKQYTQSTYRYIIVGLAIYGLVLEFSQDFLFDNRSLDIFDWLADICGILIGGLIFRKIPFSTTTNSCKKV